MVWEADTTHADEELRCVCGGGQHDLTSHPSFFVPPELTYQEVLSFKPLEPSQLPGTHEIEQ